jgi:DNA-binding transcriptional LysR family regulator
MYYSAYSTKEYSYMNLSKVDLNLFVVFDAIYTEANLTRAGEIVGITQPAVSNSLSRLRTLFNDPLFVRTSKGMSPTPMARSIIGPVRQALALMRSSVQNSEEFSPDTSDKLYRMSMSDLAEMLLLPNLFKQLRLQAPRVDVESYSVKRRDIARELASGGLDLAIDAPLIMDPHVKSMSLVTDRQVCVFRADHAQIGDKLSLDNYLSLNHLHVSTRRRGLGQVDLELGKLGAKRRVALRTRHYLMTPSILEQTDLVLTIPKRFAAYIGARHPLRFLELPFRVPPHEVHLFWHESTDQDPANRWMRDIILSFYNMETSREQVA